MSGNNNDIAIFWFRRDLRLEDNKGLWHALTSGLKVIPVFIYDREIIDDKLELDDHRLNFITDTLEGLKNRLAEKGKALYILYGNPVELFRIIMSSMRVKAVFANRDYEPYALKRDREISDLLGSYNTGFNLYKDHVIFEMDEVVKDDRNAYTVYTPYSRKWRNKFSADEIKAVPSEKHLENLTILPAGVNLPGGLPEIRKSGIRVRNYNLGEDLIAEYINTRDFPSQDGTSAIGPYLRFGTISIREVMRRTSGISDVFISELIWREFFIQVLFHFPQVEHNSYRPEYDRILWLNNEELFDRWCRGTTGFPLVDAGMRELSVTGYMHNRVRMVTANFLTRLLLIDWRWGEAWFARNLFDFELSSNNGNWQWAAGTGCDATPYFRVFNPDLQAMKFDPGKAYIRKWVPELDTPDYPSPVIDYKVARHKAIQHYRDGIRDNF